MPDQKVAKRVIRSNGIIRGDTDGAIMPETPQERFANTLMFIHHNMSFGSNEPLEINEHGQIIGLPEFQEFSQLKNMK
ncbi:hypothetical protein GC170_02755 [bacterium]|nr:hypothetical protein [bacterium]